MRVAQESRLTVLFDADCGFCTRTARLLRRLDRNDRLDLVPLQDAAALAGVPTREALLGEMHVRDTDGRWSVGGDAWLRLADEVPALRVLGWFARLPLIRRFVRPVYALFAHNRPWISRLLGADQCRQASR